MKIKSKKIIALAAMISMFTTCFVPAEGLKLLAPAPEIVIEVEEIDEPDASLSEKSDKEEGSGNGSAVDEKEADNKDKPGSEPLTDAEKTDKEKGSAVGEKDADNKDKPDSGASADTEKPEKETATEAADKETDKPAETTEAPKDTEKPEKETATEAVIDTEKPEKETATEGVTETVKPEELRTEAPTETAAANPTAKPDIKDQTDLSIASDFVAEVDGTGYADMGEAIAAWANGNTLKLVADASYGSKIIFTSGTHTFDLNGKTFTRSVKSDDGTVFDVNSGAKLTVTDTSNEKNGVITRQQGQYGGTVLFTRDSGSTINFNAGKITGMTSRVIIAWQGSTVNMSGGEISGNTLNNGDATDGIVRTYSSNSSAGGTFNMTGGKIIDNVLGNGKTGGAVYVGSNGTFNLSGNAEISGNTQNGKELNVYLPSGKTISISGALADDTSVGVTMQSGAGVITSGLSGKGAATNFTSDNSEYAVKLNADGEATLAGEEHEHDNISFTKWTATDSLPEEAGNYFLAGDVTISSTWNVPSGETKLCLNGHGIKMTGSGSVISVGSGKTLAIYDEANEGKISGGSVTSGGGAVTVDAGSLILNGGVISGNKTTGTAMGTSAGGIYLKNSASFLMNGGEISGNTSASQGGAICTDQTAVTVDIAGGEIKNNTAAKWASAIWAGRHSSAQFIIRNDAKIIDNISTDGSGTINVADTHNYIISGDPAISGKSNSGSGQNTHLNLDGNDSGLYQKVELSGPLTNDTGTPKITICAIRNTLSSGVTYVFTKNWSTYMGSANPAKYFRLDSSVTGLKIVRKDGEAAIASSGDKYVFFDPNGGTGTMDSQLVTAENTTLTGNTFARDNYSFGGWNTKADGTGTDYTDKASITLSGDLTLYAQWKKNLFDGKGTEEQPYLIKSADDWDALSAHINSGGTQYNGKYYKLTEDISVSTVLGNRPNTSTDSEDNAFSGTFDGDGHTLNVNINDPVFAAPFAVVHNTTIKNLHVTGNVTSTSNHASGLVAASKSSSGSDPSSLTIQNVTVSADISCNSHVAGIVGHAHRADITMENVVFDGSISASTVQGGFIGWGGFRSGGKFSASFKDCIFAGTYREGAAFYPVAFASGQGTAALVNDFYTTSLGSGGSPIQTSGNGQVKLFAATVEKDGAVKYFDSFSAASDSANWTDGSTLKLMADVEISNTVNIPSGKHSLDLNGHGIKMTGSGSVIRVGSGAVFELCDSGTGATHRFDMPDGAGLAALNESGGNYTLNGGYITGGTGLSGQGGGVYVNGGTFTLTAGTIIGNQVQNEGGGVFVASGSFSMNGGAIIYNKSTGHWGGGINVAGPFTMSGGSISHNYAGVGAGGVHCHALTMTGGSVTDNQSASNYAGGVNVSNTATLSGNVNIFGNTNSSGNNNLYCQSVVISDKLSEDASIGITLPNGTGVFTSGLSGKGSAKNFTSDNSDYTVSLSSSGEAELKADSHEHDGVSFTKWTSTDSLPAEAGNYCLTADVTISNRWDVPSGTTNLCLNGHAIIRTGGQETTGSAIQVGSGATLNLYDCGTETRYYTVANPAANGAGLGTVVDKSTYDAADENAKGTFTGGYITGGSITGAADGNHLIGGGVNVDCGTFTMYGGTIIGNKVCINGGGVKVRGAGASFTMNGGAILANYNDCYGGAISIGDNNGSHLSTVTINGGTIARNWSGRNGGAFHPDGNGHVISITGGSIINNYTNGNYENFHRSGGGVLVDGGNYKISGDPVIKDNLRGTEPNNVHLAQQSDVLDLSGHLASGAEVGVYVKGLTASTDIKVATGAQKEDLQYLHFDIPDEGALIYCDGTKDWIYKNGELVEFTDEVHHTHEAGTVWATAYVAPSVAITANGTTDYYNSFGDAVNAWTDGSTLKLLEDVSIDTRITVPAGKHTFDLNGKKFSELTNAGFRVGDGASSITDLTIIDSAGGGVIKHEGERAGSMIWIKEGSTLTLNGGTLEADSTASPVIDFFQQKNATFTINGGKITGKANNGAVRFSNSCVFNMNGGEISGLQTSTGVFDVSSDNGSVINISGSPIVQNNTVNGTVTNFNLPSGKLINISGALTEDALIGVTLAGGKGVFTNGLSGKGSAKNFTSDNSEYTVKLNGDGEAYITDDIASVTANGKTDYYDSLIDAINAWKGGGTLKLLEDVSYDKEIAVRPMYGYTAGEYVLDLNGKTFELPNIQVGMDNSPNQLRVGPKLTIDDSATGGTLRSQGCGMSDYGGLLVLRGGTYTGSSGTWGGSFLLHFYGSLDIYDGVTITGNSSTYGGGIFVGADSEFNMYGGKISGNSASANGGGVVVSDNDTALFNMYGGEISGNMCPGGGGIGVVNGQFHLKSSDVIIKDNVSGGNWNSETGTYTGGTPNNVYLADGKTINIDSMLPAAPIGVTLQNGKGFITSGLSDMGTAESFTSDNSEYYVRILNGEAQLTKEVPGVTVSGYEGSYDGNAHSITVSVPEGAAVKYGEAEGSYTLTENPSYTDAGTYTVYYEVSKEGFDPAVGSATVKIDKVDAAITTAPVANELIADGTAQELISAGAANGGTVWYALSRDSSASPADSEYKTEPPKATDAGAYYVWYLVKGDKNHNDLTPAYVKVTLAEQDWVIIRGVVYDSSKTPVANVTVNLTQGSKVVDTIKSDANGGYYFKVPTGLYNLVVKTDNSTTTCKKDISESMTYDIDLLDAGTETALDIIDSDKDVVVDGLNDEARSVREGDNVPADQNVSVKLTVKAVSADGTEGAKKISESAPDRNLEFYDLKVEKRVASEVSTLEETQNVLEIAIPCSFTNKRELTAYDYSASGVKTLTESSSGEAGTFRVDKSNKIMYVYLNHFSTIGIGYKPYYRIKSSVTLGSFSGNASVALKKEGSDEKYELKDVSLDAISFTDIPKGSYQMTITWKDGAEHSLTLPVTIK